MSTPNIAAMKPCPDCGSCVTRSEYVPPRIDHYVIRLRQHYERNPHLGYVFRCDCGHYFDAWNFGTPYTEDRAIRTWNHHASTQVSRTAVQRVGLSAWKSARVESVAQTAKLKGESDDSGNLIKRCKAIKRGLAPYFKVVSTGYAAFVAVRQAQHPTVDVKGWLLWTVAALATVLFLLFVLEKVPTVSLLIYRRINRRKAAR